MRFNSTIFSLAGILLAGVAACQKEAPAMQETFVEEIAIQLEEQIPAQSAASKYLVSAQCNGPVKLSTAIANTEMQLSSVAPSGYWEGPYTTEWVKTKSLFNNPFSGAKWELITYSYTYRTTDNSGRPAILSADMGFIRDGRNDGNAYLHNLETVSLFHHQFGMDTESALALSGVIMLTRSLHGALVVIPHFQGIAYNGPGNFVATSNPYASAVQAIDAELAALELFDMLVDEAALDANYYTENMGLGNGATSAMAMQRILEDDGTDQDIREAINLRATYAAEGCFDFATMLQPFLEDESDMTRKCFRHMSITDNSRPYILLSFLNSAMFSHPELFSGISFEDYFCEEFNSLSPDPENPERTIREYLNQGRFSTSSNFFMANGFTTLRSMLNPDLFDEMSGALNMEDARVKALLDVCEMTNISEGWEPKTRLFITHSTEDDLIPADSVIEACEKLSDGGANKNVLFEIRKSSTHTVSALGYLVRDIILEKHPCPLY